MKNTPLLLATQKAFARGLGIIFFALAVAIIVSAALLLTALGAFLRLAPRQAEVPAALPLPSAARCC